MQKIFLFFILIGISIQTTTYDQGTYTLFSYSQSGFNCQDGFTRTNTITFTNAFQNIPQIIYYFNTLDYIYSNKNSVVVEIVSVTLAQFSIKITCSNNRVNSYFFRWVAIDDSRIQIITEINISPFPSKQYLISNPNIKKAVLTILSFSYSGQFNIDLSITELTSDHVTVGMNGASLNLNSFSYQIILGTDEVLNVLSQISSSSAYTSSTFNLQANSYFLLACTKFTTNLLSIRFAIDVNQASSTVSYLTRTWSSNTYPNNGIQPFFLKYIQEQYFLAMECFTARINKLFDMTVDQKPAFEMKILELNKVYSSVTSESIVIDPSILLLNIHIFYKCPSNNKKVLMELNKCNNCSGNNNKIYKRYHYCHGSINSINLFAKYSAQPNYKQIQIIVTSNTLNIVQKLINKATTEQNILKVQFLDN